MLTTKSLSDWMWSGWSLLLSTRGNKAGHEYVKSRSQTSQRQKNFEIRYKTYIRVLLISYSNGNDKGMKNLRSCGCHEDQVN